MSYLSIASATLGQLVSDTEADQIKENIEVLRKAVQAPTGSSPNGNTRFKSFNITATSIGGNWAIDGTNWLDLTPMLGRATNQSHFVIWLSGNLTVVAGTAAIAVGNIDLLSSSSAPAAPAGTHLGAVFGRTPAVAGTYQFPVAIMRAHVNPSTSFKVFPAVSIESGGVGSTANFNGQMYYIEI